MVPSDRPPAYVATTAYRITSNQTTNTSGVADVLFPSLGRRLTFAGTRASTSLGKSDITAAVISVDNVNVLLGSIGTI
ncbi:unnamed protein product, partial [Mesorhabditis belari]|uniref:Uncharacterized protein n=1 Tax=Mesorhabditis belari TaxID=2138241 RepID=A0AAF3EMS3_9BILA